MINLHAAFQDKYYLFMILDYKPGGDLRFHMQNGVFFTEIQTQFIIACVLTTLEFLHTNRCIHRDIRPENLTFDEYGYVHLTEFGSAKFIKENKIEGKSGAPCYMAPEVMNR